MFTALSTVLVSRPALLNDEINTERPLTLLCVTARICRPEALGLRVEGDALEARPLSLDDAALRELAALVPLAAACLWIGVKPQPIVDVIRPDVEAVAKLYDGRTPVDLKALAVAEAENRSGQEQ